MRAVNHIFTSSAREHLATVANNPDKKLLTFEEIDQFSGFVLYESKLPEIFTRDPTNLVVEKLRDRALVYVDEKFVGVLSRENLVKSLPVTKGYAGKKLQIFVENQGRINFQENFDLKGILGNVTVQTFDFPYYQDIQDWTVSGYPFEDYASIERFINSNGFTYQLNKKGWLKEGPVLFHGELNIQNADELHDTWFHVRGWGKGVLFVNGFNLGRYWSVGPQMTNYIPKEHLRVGSNSIVVLELQKAPVNLEFNFSDVADYNEN
jgi:beta-galactosidase